MELYLEQGQLVSREAWEEIVGKLKRTNSLSLEVLKHTWMQAFEQAVLTRAKHSKSIGVLFSGGVDSTIISFVLSKHKIPFCCYTVGFKDPGTKQPEDILEARKIAKHFGWKHREILLDLKELEPVLRSTKEVLGDVANPVTVGVAGVVMVAGKIAVADGVDLLFSGLGSEEIFAGYHRHEKASRAGGLDEEGWRGLLKMYDRDLIRDVRVAQALNVPVATPFMDAEVMALALQMPSELKIKDGHKKYILRVMCEEYGLPHEFAFRQKKAAQYGSRM
ncbi:MAG TPA: asparagine synthase C-terminal domain-containing protein, partial [Nitrososphaera sp.]|nr:asparagine synthase C-terminal domain-containing protein [Nitrososphaera sp.]